MPEAPPALLALIDAGLALARRSSSGKLVFGRMEGVVHPDLVPERIREPVRAELEAGLAATATPVERKTVEKALKGARLKVDDLSGEAVSVSSMAVVHTAELDGDPVAVKVLRPGVASTVRSELTLLDVLTGPIRAVFRSLDVAGVLRELREAALDELDLDHEADQQQRVRRALRRVDGVVVPEVAGEGSSEVLVTERLRGVTLKDGVADDPDATARRLVQAHLVAWREAGLVMTDCRPSHVVHLDDGSTGLLGTGVARPVPRERAEHGVAAFAALADSDPAAFVAAVAEDGMGILPADVAAEAHPLLRGILGPLVDGPARLDGPALADVTVRAFRQIGPLLAIGAQATPQPSDLAAARMLGQLAATLSRLEVTEDWVALASETAGVR